MVTDKFLLSQNIELFQLRLKINDAEIDTKQILQDMNVDSLKYARRIELGNMSDEKSEIVIEGELTNENGTEGEASPAYLIEFRQNTLNLFAPLTLKFRNTTSRSRF